MGRIPGHIRLQRRTQRRAAIIACIAAYQAAHPGQSPSIREIMAECGIRWLASAVGTIDMMVADGLLRRNPGHARNLVVAERTEREA